MPCRPAPGLLVVLALMGCQADLTTPAPRPDERGIAGVAATDPTAGSVVCPACTFEPRLYTRSTGTPITEVVTFAGNPAGAYTIEIDDLGTQGANASVDLNGERLKVRSGQLRQDVVLDWENALHVRLTGKPGSKLSVRVFQEVASVTVTPASARSRIAAALQFTAVAKDRNGVEIPRQTFTWESRDLTIATIDATTGLATTTGPVHNMAAWNYKTISTGEGAVEIVAHADSTTDKSGTAPWTVVAGFVYTTYQAPLPLESPKRATRPAPLGFRYDTPRLQAMAATCASESHNPAWRARPVGGGERLFKQCYPLLELETPTRHWVPPTPVSDGFYVYGSDTNIGLYGRYCGGGQPDGEWWDRAWLPGYQPKDPIDAMCMEHDRSEDLHEIPASQLIKAGCILRYGIEAETLYEEGVRIQPGSARWNAFWSAWPAMAQARAHWIGWASSCSGPIYTNFLNERGL
ncbi:MAG TPA: hypothetical protein VFU01_15025 [Gemmatimonadaceae bacterium]|nr:hypothetical protein [Gemmatimonadaceae bacterium]